MHAAARLLPIFSALSWSVGCASTARPTPAPPAPPPPVATVTQAPPVDAGAPATAIDPCAGGPVHAAISALAAGRVLADRAAAGPPRAWERTADLAPLFPALRAAGHRVLAVTPTDVFEGAALVALLAPSDATIDDEHQVSAFELGVLTCRAGEGWMLAAPPFGRGGDAGLQLHPPRVFTLPGGARALTVPVYSFLATRETNLSLYVVGTGSATLPVSEPSGAAVGVLGIIGTLEERTVAEGTAEYRSTTSLDASAWYPEERDTLVFVRVARERTPQEGGRWDDGVLATPMARIDAHGFHATDSEPATWLLVGPGATPAWCSGRTDLRCGLLARDASPITDLAQPMAWVAGAWTVGAGAAPRDLRAPGARWFYAGAWQGDRPPRDPSGRAPLTHIAARPARP